jgi:DNA-binding NarL/FixJ family response regulator
LADDHAVVRAGLRMLLEAQPDLEVVAEASSGEEALEAAQRTQPHIAVVDLSMPEVNGVETIRRLRESAPQARIVVLTMHDDAGSVRAAFAAGAAAYVVKKAADRDLILAIRAVTAGRSYLAVDLAAELEGSGHALPGGPTLSAREEQVLELLAMGHTNREIAERLRIGVKSVETYRARLREKLGARSRADLVRVAIELGIVTKQ